MAYGHPLEETSHESQTTGDFILCVGVDFYSSNERIIIKNISKFTVDGPESK